MMNDNESTTDIMAQTSGQDGENEEPKEELRDHYHLTFILLYILGTLTQIPSNFFITANDYWMYKFRDVNSSNFEDQSHENKTHLQANFTSSFSIVSNVAMVLSVFATLRFIRIVSMKMRFTVSLSIICVVFILTLALVEVDSDTWQEGFFGLTLTMAFILTAANGTFMLSVYQLAAKFHPRYIAAVISGQSICGITAALAQIFALGIGASPLITAIIYFSIGTLFVMGSILMFYLVYTKSAFFYHHFNKDLSHIPTEKITKRSVLIVLGKIKLYLLTMVIVLGCSIMVHPAVTSLVVSVGAGHGNKWNDKFYKPVITFLLYNVIDLVGRELAAVIEKPTNGIVLVTIGLLRLIFIPIFMFCNAQPRHHTKVYFDNDYTYIISIIIFGFTNGYFTNLAILEMPKSVQISEKKISIILIVLVMIVSLGICSSINALLVNAL